ncbi:hypothetical protein [Streptomyces sp. ITFR-6]|uniref:deoxynucleotide monophosphate kinase family protein n=1 Tax=Streptomyces sp. ITFR-6 TaxID=3075197 RepID=UPI00288A6CE4|nr:hypothetical protein [Streptomyces sp. ITFR-6]WNI28652.1 hypothetical protein RLT59_07500 [Streptomyces sp. ITFR-6]
MANIGITGRMRVGKDTAGQWLVDNRGYRRVSFADPLRDAALKLDPFVTQYGSGPMLRLSNVVRDAGWERAKDGYPEVRRILQELGASIRAIDPEFWLRTALAKVRDANEAGVPAVITDVRYPNEAASLKAAGFHLLYIERPDVPQLQHESEGALTAADADYAITNDGTRELFLAKLQVAVAHIYTDESRRQYARSHS